MLFSSIFQPLGMILTEHLCCCAVKKGGVAKNHQKFEWTNWFYLFYPNSISQPKSVWWDFGKSVVLVVNSQNFILGISINFIYWVNNWFCWFLMSVGPGPGVGTLLRVLLAGCRRTRRGGGVSAKSRGDGRIMDLTLIVLFLQSKPELYITNDIKWSRIGMSENGVYHHKKKNGDLMGIMMIHQ